MTMKMMMSLTLLFFSLFLASPSRVHALKVGFYKSTCPKAETIIRQTVRDRFNIKRSVTAKLLRMHFHDCFVTGCDASILIDSTDDNQSEKEAGPNQTVGEFNLIDKIKFKLEQKCPGTVSCADIITLATRDAVALAGGPKYKVPTGRRDGLFSNIGFVDLPGPSLTIAEARQAFAQKNLSLEDMITLLGAHTVGVAHCSFFSDRLSNFQGTNRADPTMNPKLVKKLTNTCASTKTADPTAFLDQKTPFIVDNSFYKQIRVNNGVLKIDQELALDRLSSRFVSTLASNNAFFRKKFARAMVKMGNLNVLEGTDGEIRNFCRVFNF